MWTRAALVIGLLAGLAAGCGSQRGDKAMGESCGDANECRHGLCVEGVAGDHSVCTRSCRATSECPRGWACSGVTEGNVLVCTQGSPTPFGFGTRE